TQPGGELAPADPATRTRHETLPHPRRSPTVPGGVQRDLPAFPAPPAIGSPPMTIAPRWPTASPPGTTSPGRRKPPEPRTSTAPEPPSALFPLHLKQVDKALASHPWDRCDGCDLNSP